MIALKCVNQSINSSFTKNSQVLSMASTLFAETVIVVWFVGSFCPEDPLAPCWGLVLHFLMCLFLMCLFRSEHLVKVFVHNTQEKTLCSVCILMWDVKLSLSVNASSHTTHLYGASLLWVLMWTVRLPLSRNALSHTVHLYGVSLVWVLMWAVRWLLWLHTLSHTAHLNWGIFLESIVQSTFR